MEKINQSIKIGILGPGAIGSLVGSLLYRAGNEVVFLCKEHTQKNINLNGLNIKSNVYGNFVLNPRAETDLNDIFDIIFITVKAYELKTAMQAFSNNIGEHTIIFSLLNGIGNKEIITKFHPKNTLIGTIGAVEVFLDENRNIIHSSTCKTHIEFALNSDFNYSTGIVIVNLLKEAGFSVNILKTENEVIWRKLVRLSAISTLTSIAGAPLGRVRENLELNTLLKSVVIELCDIAKTQQIYFLPEDIVEQIWALPESLTTSMQRDIQLGKKSEIEAILGNPIRLGKYFGLTLPYLDECYLSLVNN